MYFIETYDREGTVDLRKSARKEHLDYLDATKDVLLMCGAKIDEETGEALGGLYLVDVATKEEAEAYIQADPFSKIDLFRDVSIYEWRRAIFNRESFIQY